jgi:signal transduction histidine kinase
MSAPGRSRLMNLWSFVRSNRAVGLAIAVCAATATLVWLGYQATAKANHSTRLLLERRVAEQMALLSAALTQDMRGAHATVLVPVTQAHLVLEPPYDLAEAFARGFARFPYPEFFFTWNDFRGEDVVYVFTRADRPPVWHGLDRLGGPYPVVVSRNPMVVRELVAQAREKARDQRRVALFDTTIGGVDYQLVVNLLHSDSTHVSGLVGFAVNLDWVRAFYFDELVQQVARIGGTPDEMSVQILDDKGHTVVSTSRPRSGIPSAVRALPLVFVDRALLGTLPPLENRRYAEWTVRVGVADHSPTAIGLDGVDTTFILISLAALATVAGLVVTVRGARIAAELATMKSDFVSSVTHELKTPLAVIRLIADTLAQGRYESTQTVRDYAALLSRETGSLGRLIDNLLTYARLSDVKHAYTFEAIEVSELVEEVLQHFQTLLAEQQFTVEVDLPRTLPAVRADRLAAVQVLDNVIDNVVKYSHDVRAVEIRAGVVGNRVAIRIADRGIGIREDELTRVSEKFFRGRDAQRGGSGLGLAIVRQVVEAHGGDLHIAGRPGGGTAVEVLFPRAATS